MVGADAADGDADICDDGGHGDGDDGGVSDAEGHVDGDNDGGGDGQDSE
jgi:hypothetical protein